jgi:hypothetical protein
MNIISIGLIFAAFVVSSIGALGLYTKDASDTIDTSIYFLLAIFFILLAVVIQFFW